MPNNIIVKDEKEWLTNGHATIECGAAYKVIGILKELAACRCNAEISHGIIWLEDGTHYNLEKLVREAIDGSY